MSAVRISETAFQRHVREAPRDLGFRGRQVLAFIQSVMDRTGDPPSYSMIADEFGFNDNSHVRQVVVRLEQRGLVQRSGSGRSRRLILINMH